MLQRGLHSYCPQWVQAPMVIHTQVSTKISNTLGESTQPFRTRKSHGHRPVSKSHRDAIYGREQPLFPLTFQTKCDCSSRAPIFLVIVKHEKVTTTNPLKICCFREQFDHRYSIVWAFVPSCDLLPQTEICPPPPPPVKPQLLVPMKPYRTSFVIGLSLCLAVLTLYATCN